MKTPDSIVIADGGWPTAVAVYLQADPGAVALLPTRCGGKCGEARSRVTERLAETVGIPVLDGPTDWLANGRTATLMTAALAAHRLGATRVIDPVMVDGDIDAMAREVERAQLVEGLLESDGIRVVFDQPLVDLTAEQVALLAVDQGLPNALAWSCETDSARLCGSCEGCRKWTNAFASVESPAAV